MDFLQTFDRFLGDSALIHRILLTETGNRNRIYMYLVGDMWVSFQRSAYQVRRLCPGSTEAALKVESSPCPLAAAFVRKDSLTLSSAHTDRRENGYLVRVYGTDSGTSGYAEWMESLISEVSLLG